MSQNSRMCPTSLQPCQGDRLDPRYLQFFECFNQQRFFEAHEVLEALWLPERGLPRASFYKGLIQLAGAFVHLQKSRPLPAASLLRLARVNLATHAPVQDRLELTQPLALIDAWLAHLAVEHGLRKPLPAPVLYLQPAVALSR